MRDSLLHIVKGAKQKRLAMGEGVWRDAKLLEASMKGFGTNGEEISFSLTSITYSYFRISRYNVDQQVRAVVIIAHRGLYTE